MRNFIGTPLITTGYVPHPELYIEAAANIFKERFNKQLVRGMAEILILKTTGAFISKHTRLPTEELRQLTQFGVLL